MSSPVARDRAASAVAFAAAIAAALAAPAPTAAAAAAAAVASSSSAWTSSSSLSAALCSSLPWMPLCSKVRSTLLFYSWRERGGREEEEGRTKETQEKGMESTTMKTNERAFLFFSSPQPQPLLSFPPKPNQQPSPPHLWFAPSRAPPSPLSTRALELLRSACLIATDSTSPACSSTSSSSSSLSTASPLAQLLLQLLRPSSLAALSRHFFESAWELMRPGGPLHPVALRKASGHVVLEAALAVIVVFLLSQRQSRPRSRGQGGGGGGGGVAPGDELTDAEVEGLCDEWIPEPLVFSAGDERRASEAHAAAVAAAATHALAAEAAEAAAAARAAATNTENGSSSPSPPVPPLPAPAVIQAHLLVPPPPALDGVIVARRGPGPWVTVSSCPSSSSSSSNEDGNSRLSNKRVLDFASLDFLGLAGDPSISKAAEAAIAKYGVGSCGPRGFYGTIDAHLELESALAKFYGTDEAILYSYDLATAPSVLPAFASARDVVVLDDAAPWALSNGAALSRARVRRFAHGDAASLESVLRNLAEEDARAQRPPCRRFIVVEGVAASDGAVAPLPEIVRLKRRYKYRLVVDESLALGALGERGRGACEHFGLRPAGVCRRRGGEGDENEAEKKKKNKKRKGGGEESESDEDAIPDVDVIIATLGGALASIGGFCAASREIVDHQRLSGAGYCFSASLPPFLAVEASEALARLSKDGEEEEEGKGRKERGGGSRLERVRARALALRSALLDSPAPGLYVCGCDEEGGGGGGGGTVDSSASSVSPTIHLRLDPWAFPPGVAADPPTAEGLLRRVAADALARDGVLSVACAAGAGPLEARAAAPFLPPAPSLRLSVSASHSEADVRRAAGAVRAAARRVLSRLLLPAALKGNTPSPTQQRQKQFAANGFVCPSPTKMAPLSPLRNASPLRAKSAALSRDGF